MDSLFDPPRDAFKPNVVTIGFFDGVHLGHRYLIEQVKNEAEIRGFASALLTFPHSPRRVIDTDYKPELLTSHNEKMGLIDKLDISYAFVSDFTPGMAKFTAYEFMRFVIKERCNAEALVIGHDHRFGYGLKEGFKDYCRYGKELDIEVLRARAYKCDGLKINSSLIRNLIKSGYVGIANTYLGYEYVLEGKVVKGSRVGREMGFPTANLLPTKAEKLIPANGVYAVRVTVNGAVYDGMMYIGVRPTVSNGSMRTIEVHLLHFNEDIYDRMVRVTFVDRIRSEKKFANKDKLAEQLAKDLNAVNRLLHPEGK